MRSTLATIVMSLSLVVVGCSEGRPPESSPHPLVTRIDSLVPRLLDETGTPGAVVTIVEDGRTVLARGYGFRDAVEKAPMTDTTLINVASLSKAVTTWGVLRVWQDGLLSLKAPVNRYLRSWKLEGDGFDTSRSTVERLLNHTAGVGLPAVPWFPVDSAVPALREVLRGEAGESDPVRVIRRPGEAWDYSGGGYTVLQLLIEEITGLPFDQFMRDSVFAPLGMHRSTFGAPPDGAARGYDEDGEPQRPSRYVGASAGGLLTTAGDFGRLLQAYTTAWDSGNEVLDFSTLRRVADGPIPVELDGVSGAFYGLGHGVHETRDGRLLLYHSGGNPGFKAYFIVDPAGGDGLFAAVNSDNGVPLLAALREYWGEAHGDDLPPLF